MLLVFLMSFVFNQQRKNTLFLKCQIGISKTDTECHTNGRGGRRYLPYVFTKQGISMLASVLHSEIAINANLKSTMIIDFVTRRKL